MFLRGTGGPDLRNALPADDGDSQPFDDRRVEETIGAVVNPWLVYATEPTCTGDLHPPNDFV